VPLRDPEALGEALGALCADPAPRRRMGERGRAIVLDAFTSESVIRRTLGVYEELWRDRPGRVSP
jgi:glycosyltransferase involved in cell wall biosynthesis